MKRSAGLLLGLAVVSLSSSCAVQRTIGREDLSADIEHNERFHRFAKAPGQRVASYTTADYAIHTFEGHAWIEGDSMVFDRPASGHGMDAIQSAVRQRVALSDLASVDGLEVEWGHTVFFVIVMSAAAILVAGLSDLSSW